jgi:hypothetical protein
MSFKRLVLIAFVAAVALVLSATAHAAKFSLTGGGGQAHIGNGLALPIQQAVPNGTTFPSLKVPHVPGATVSGTTQKPLLTAMATAAGPVTKQGYQRKLVVPVGVLAKSAAQTTVGVKFSNPTLFAVGTNLNWVWPAAPAVFSTGAAVPVPVVSVLGGKMTYSNTLGSRFGGAAQFLLSPGAAAGLIAAPVTIYGKINASPTGTPACTHPVFPGGANPACVAGILGAFPSATGLLGPGGAAFATVMTAGVPGIAPNVAAVKLGLTPLGTISAAALVATAGLPTNKATSAGGQWTTGQIIIEHPTAAGAGEKFTLSGKDSRTAGGRGTIQMVSGAISKRNFTGPNANRGWVELQLDKDFADGNVPAMSPSLLAAVGGLILLAGGYAARRRLSA